MNPFPLAFYKQQGFSLLEALVGLVIFAIIFLGSTAALIHLSSTQAQINTSLIITNTLQSRLQLALNHDGTSDICTAIDQSSFNIGNQTYYALCTTETILVGSADTAVEWPILIASVSMSDAQDCVNGTIKESCYIVGR